MKATPPTPSRGGTRSDGSRVGTRGGTRSDGRGNGRSELPGGWGGGFKAVRVGILLLILVIVAVTTWQDRYRSTRWREPLYVAIYPIAADDSPVTTRYLAALDAERFKPIDRFFVREGQRYHLDTDEPVRTRLRMQLHAMPPQRAPTAGLLSTAFWSLQLRYWAWRASGHVNEPEDIRMFVLYHDPALTPTVPHSLGLTKGLIGVVYAFAAPEMNGENDVIIAHELLHTVGATDKYEPGSDAPRFPDGYGDPQQVPLYPQRTAELMAGRRMLSANKWEQPDSLGEVVIGPATALEIRWPQHSHTARRAIGPSIASSPIWGCSMMPHRFFGMARTYLVLASCSHCRV